MTNLIKYDQARLALAECRNVDEVKDIRDKSEAMRLYAKQANDTELEQWAAEIKLRAQRAIGEISAGLEKQQGKTELLPAGGKKFKAEALADAGISTSTAHRYEQLAAIPEPAVEAYIARSKEAGKPVSAKAALAEAKPKPEPTVAPPKPADFSESDAAPKPAKGRPVENYRTTGRDEPDGPAATELDALREENAALRSELDDVKASFAETLADNESMGRVIDADDQLKAAMDEVKRLSAVAESAERTLRAKSGECAQAIRTAKHWKNRAERAEKLNQAAA
jgi:uncharacterized protein YjiS (DUF1127 family)